MPGYGEEHRIPRGLSPDIEERLEIEAGEAYERGVQSGLKLREAAAAEARRAAIEECAKWLNDRASNWNGYRLIAHDMRAALASSTPQEE